MNKKEIRAFEVVAEGICEQEIVFAKSHNDAKKLVYNLSNAFDGCDYIELRASLNPAFEELNNGVRKIVDFCENADLFFENDWRCLDPCGDNDDCVYNSEERAFD